MIQSLVLESSERQVAIITLDLLAIDFEEVDEIRRKAGSLGLQPEDVLVAASHTHSGPPSIDFGLSRKNKETSLEIIDKAEQSLREALQKTSSTSVRVGFSGFRYNVNRRRRTWFGRMKTGVNLGGAVDHQVSSLLFDTGRGKILLLCYGCHPVLNRHIPLASADYVSGCREIAASNGMNATFFLNGALGNVNPYDGDIGRSLDMAGIEAASTFGRKLGAVALNSTLDAVDEPSPKVEANSASIDVSLPRIKGGQVNRRLAVQVIRIGKFAMATFPGEMFAETALELRARTGISRLATVSCANGYIGYAPPIAEYSIGGYEVNEAPLRFGFRIPPGTTENLRRTAETLSSNASQNA
jgi:hypothetical protein